MYFRFSEICLFTFHVVTLFVGETFNFYPIPMRFPRLSSPFADRKGQIIGLANGLGLGKTCITFGRGSENSRRVLQLTSPLWCSGRHVYLHDVDRLSSLLGTWFPRGPCDACSLCRSEKPLSFGGLGITIPMPSLTWSMPFYFVLIIKVGSLKKNPEIYKITTYNPLLRNRHLKKFDECLIINILDLLYKNFIHIK